MLVSLDDLKEFLEINTTSFDTKLNHILNGIDKRVKQYCGKNFEQDTYTDEIVKFSFGNGFVNNTPVESVSKVTDLDGNSVYFNLIDNETGEIELYFLTNNRFKVSYTGGLLAEDIPEDLKLAVLKWCEYEYNNQTGIQSFSLDSVSTKAELTKSGIPTTVERILDGYRNIRL
jgi:hypothetical protein